MNYFNHISDIESLISRLIDKLDSSRTESLELEVGDVRIKLDRHSPMPHHHGMPPAPITAAPIAEPITLTAQPTEPAAAPTAAPAPTIAEALPTVNAPLLGVAYAASAPDAEPFVKVGQTVKKGDIICIIEAMKVMNEIESDRDGVIMEILFENGKMVEYGQPLVAIK